MKMIEKMEERKIENQKEVDTQNLINLAQFLRDFRKTVKSNKGPFFWGKNMCHIDKNKGIVIEEDEAIIRNGDDVFSISYESVYYISLIRLLETLYEGKIKRRKIVRQMQFLFKRVMGTYQRTLKEVTVDM